MWWLKSYTNHNEKIAVPNLIGVHQTELADLAKEKGIKYKIIDSIVAFGIPVGSVKSQDPVAYSENTKSYMKSERPIYLTIVKKPNELVEVPYFVEQHQRIVETKLKTFKVFRDFNIKRSYAPGEFAGEVLKQLHNGRELKKGQKLKRGSEIEIVYSSGRGGESKDVPDLVGLTHEEALMSIDEGTITLSARFQNCPTLQDTLTATIFEQDPAFGSGRQLKEGENLIIYLRP